jgi:hypothetical protein
MPKYMLLMYHPPEGPPAADMAGQHQQWTAFDKELKDDGVFVSNHGLKGAEAATTVRVRAGETQITDGPFAETKEILAGYFVVDVSDLDTALEYAGRMPNVTYGSVEVRPVWG